MKNVSLFPADLSDYLSELARQGEQFAATKRRMEKQRAELRSLVLASIAAGVSESEAARQAGITRKTVRDWQGKK